MKVKWVAQSYPTLCDPMDCPWNSPGQNTGVGSFSLFQGIFPTQGSNPGLPHCRQILYQLSHQGSPRILEWVAYPFSRGSSRPRSRTGVSHIAGGFFIIWASCVAFSEMLYLYPKKDWRWKERVGTRRSPSEESYRYQREAQLGNLSTSSVTMTK